MFLLRPAEVVRGAASGGGFGQLVVVLGAGVAAGRRVEAGGWCCGRVLSTRPDSVAWRRMAPAAVYNEWWCVLPADGGTASPASPRSFGRGCGSDCVSLWWLRVLFALFWVSLFFRVSLGTCL